MPDQEHIQEFVCCALANALSKQTIDLVLNTYIPNYEPQNFDYTYPINADEAFDFESEDQMVNYFFENEDQWRQNQIKRRNK